MQRSVLRPRLLLADDQPLLLEAFRALLEPEFDVIALASSEHELFAECGRLKPDVVVLDVKPGANARDLEAGVRLVSPGTKVIILADDAAPVTGRAVCVRKSSSARDLKRAVRQAVQTVTPTERIAGLTTRQVQVLQLLAQGLSMKEVAGRLEVTPRTVAFHKYSIMRHLRLTTTAELVQFAMRHGLVPA